MGETRIELTGWKAIAALVVILGVSGIRIYTRFPTVNDEGREAVRTWLVKDYTGRGVKALAQRVADYRAGLPDRPLEVPAVEPKVEFVSLLAHGSPSDMIARAEVSVDGGPPPDGRPVRYLFLTTVPERGWVVFTEADSYQYYEILLGRRWDSSRY
jgi:pyridoxine/pyridoxamine 5'-phosphate oxidase